MRAQSLSWDRACTSSHETTKDTCVAHPAPMTPRLCRRTGSRASFAPPLSRAAAHDSRLARLLAALGRRYCHTGGVQAIARGARDCVGLQRVRSSRRSFHQLSLTQRYGA
jgi:hypothetical protein